MSQTRRCTDQCHRPDSVQISVTDQTVYRPVSQTRRCTDQCHRTDGVQINVTDQTVYRIVRQTRRCTDQCDRPGGVQISVTDQAVYRSVSQTRRCTDQCHRPGGVQISATDQAVYRSVPQTRRCTQCRRCRPYRHRPPHDGLLPDHRRPVLQRDVRDLHHPSFTLRERAQVSAPTVKGQGERSQDRVKTKWVQGV